LFHFNPLSTTSNHFRQPGSIIIRCLFYVTFLSDISLFYRVFTRSLPFDLSLPPAKKQLRNKFQMIDYIQKGGLLMWPILICSVVSIAVFAERLFYLHRATIHVGEFLQGLSNLLKRRNFAEALHESAGTPGPVARVIHAAILHHNAPRAELREIVQEAGQLEVPKLERFLGVLATLAYLAPLLGLLGTVTGMIDAFGTLSANGGYATVTELSSGVYKSLLTTAAGLVVATPTFVAYSYLSSRVNRLMHEMERAGIEAVHMLSDREPVNDIITFHAAVEEKAR
jgi:biopolymer transport protein ExbB